MIRLIPPIPTGDTHTLGIGVFDGLHLGHQEILKRTDGLLTFYPHPDTILGKSNIRYLTVLDEMRALHPRCFVMDFDEHVARMSAEAFLDYAVRNAIGPKKIVVGEDFHFGYKKSGNVHVLKDWAEHCGIEVEIVPLLETNGQLVKSSRIRILIEEGRVEDAARLLGRPYLIMGPVIHGDGRGKSLGFPTANIQVDPLKLLPLSGVYCGSATVAEGRIPAMIYIGAKPTFSETGEIVMEVFLPDFESDLYGKTLSVWITHRLRGDQKFDSKDALIAQINLDIEAAKNRQ